LPTFVSLQKTVPFGDAVISTLDTCIGVEVCEELFTSKRFVNMDGEHLLSYCRHYRQGCLQNKDPRPTIKPKTPYYKTKIPYYKTQDSLLQNQDLQNQDPTTKPRPMKNFCNAMYSLVFN
jgi:hypothetical protein